MMGGEVGEVGEVGETRGWKNKVTQGIKMRGRIRSDGKEGGRESGKSERVKVRKAGKVRGNGGGDVMEGK